MNLQNGRETPFPGRWARQSIALALALLTPALANAAPPAPAPAPAAVPVPAPAAVPAPAPAPAPAPVPAPAPAPVPVPAAVPELGPPPPPMTAAPQMQMPPLMPPSQKPAGWGADPAYSMDTNLPMLPRRLEYEEGDFIPPGYELKTKATKSLVVGGLITFFVPYGLSAIVGAAVLANGNDGSVSEFGPLVIPVIGPFITMAQDDDFQPDAWYRFFMLANGFTQATGAAMIAAGILLPTQYLEFTDRLPGKPVVGVGPGSASVRLSF